MRSAEKRNKTAQNQESDSNTPFRSTLQDEGTRATLPATRTKTDMRSPLSTNQSTYEAQKRINEKFNEYAKKIVDNSRLSVVGKEERQSRLERCRAFLVNLIYVGYAPALVDSWSDDLLDDEVVDGMPMDLVDLYWGPPIYTQSFVEYYVPYQNRGYRTPAGDYRQVTFANNVVAESQPGG
jgi:hypothetical protein